MNSKPTHEYSPDLSLLVFLWKWKLLSTAALSAIFYPKLLPNSAYNKIRKLHQEGFIEMTLDRLRKVSVWSLTRRGFEVIKSNLPELKDVGFKSENIYHDFLATCFHLGNFDRTQASRLQYFTEQELRRYDPDSYKDWVPLPYGHRPDGYTLVPNGLSKEVVAFEVELSCKRNEDYQVIARAYSRNGSTDRVLWLVPKLSMANKIFRLMQEVEPNTADMHCFFLCPDFFKSGWGAVCKTGGRTGTTIAENLKWNLSSSGVVPLTNLLLDTRKWQTNFKTYRSA